MDDARYFDVLVPQIQALQVQVAQLQQNAPKSLRERCLEYAMGTDAPSGQVVSLARSFYAFVVEADTDRPDG